MKNVLAVIGTMDFAALRFLAGEHPVRGEGDRGILALSSGDAYGVYANFINLAGQLLRSS